jgi:hypothetical protein
MQTSWLHFGNFIVIWIIRLVAHWHMQLNKHSGNQKSDLVVAIICSMRYLVMGHRVGCALDTSRHSLPYAP